MEDQKSAGLAPPVLKIFSSSPLPPKSNPIQPQPFKPFLSQPIHTPVIQKQEASNFQRDLWLSFFDHHIPRMFLANYMNDTGDPILLNAQQMQDCNPLVNIRRSEGMITEMSRLQLQMQEGSQFNYEEGGEAGAPDFIETDWGTTSIREQRGYGSAMTNGSLGNFIIIYNGTLRMKRNGFWSFEGTMRFYDWWDFDPRSFISGGRSGLGEIKTRVGAFIPGRPFSINSVTVPVRQTRQMELAIWGDHFTPRYAGDLVSADYSRGDTILD